MMSSKDLRSVYKPHMLVTQQNSYRIIKQAIHQRQHIKPLRPNPTHMYVCIS